MFINHSSLEYEQQMSVEISVESNGVNKIFEENSIKLTNSLLYLNDSKINVKYPNHAVLF